MQQIWKGVHGDFGIYSASIPLPRLIGEALYLEFPRGWDSKAKEILQDEYQLTYVKLQRGMFSICCIPDGAFRVIALPVGARNLRAVFEWLTRASETFNLPFPFDAYARPVFQAVNYLEGRAPEWTTNSAAVFDRSIADTGFIPLGSLVREKGSDGTAAWTLRREVYVVLINVPFGGMTEMLERLRSAEGAIRYRADRDLSFDLQPVVFPQGLDLQTKSIAVWDRARTTRSFWLLQSDSDPKSVAKQPNIQHSKEEASQLIRRVEEISVQQLEFLSRG
jgi:hypothetical protein